MDMNISVTAPRHVPDTRPAADAAAVTRDPRPEVPAPAGMAAAPLVSTSLVGAVSRSMMIDLGAEAAPGRDGAAPVVWTERTLKPYGIGMLPATDHNQGPAEAGKAGRAAPGAGPVPPAPAGNAPGAAAAGAVAASAGGAERGMASFAPAGAAERGARTFAPAGAAEPGARSFGTVGGAERGASASGPGDRGAPSPGAGSLAERQAPEGPNFPERPATEGANASDRPPQGGPGTWTDHAIAAGGGGTRGGLATPGTGQEAAGPPPRDPDAPS